MNTSSLVIAALLAIVSDVPSPDPDRIARDVQALAAFPTRNTLSDDNVRAADWLERRFRDMGYDDVTRHPFTYRGVERSNVVATTRVKPGTDSLILIGAHYDSRSSRLGDAQARAPGADDNASGVAALLELARLLADLPDAPAVRFIAYSGEEQGLHGARAYASLAKQEKMNISVVINMDMVGHPIDPDRREIFIEHDPGLSSRDNDAPSRAWTDRLLRACEKTDLRAKEGPIFGSDYIEFEKVGYPCVGLFDGADTQPFYHSSDDDISTVDPAYTAKAASIVLGAILDR